MVDDARPPTGVSPEPVGHPDAHHESTATPYGPERPAFAPRPRPPLIERVGPVTALLQSYGRRRYLRPDLMAGVTVAALAIPSGMAYAELAGLSPVAGRPLIEALEAAGLTDRIGATNLYPNIEAAVVACAQKTEPA
jgi:hypothetical protein